MSPARRRALAALHAARRGRRQHPGGASAGAALARLHHRGLRLALHPAANPVSQRSLARRLGVDVRTIGRWIRGVHYPSPDHAAAITRLVRSNPLRR